MGLSMGGTLVARLAEQRAGRGRRAGAGQPVARHRAQGRQVLVPLLRRVVPSMPGIGSDIRKPGVTRAGVRPDAAAGAALADRSSGSWSSGRPRPDHRADAALPQPRRPRRRAAVRPAAAGRRSPARSSEVILEDRYHVATLDHDAPEIFAGSVDVRAARARPAPARPAGAERRAERRAGGGGATTGWTRPRSCRCSTSTRGSASTCSTCSRRPVCRPSWSRPRTSSRTPGRCRCPRRRPTGSGSTGRSAGRPGDRGRRDPARPRPAPRPRDDEPLARADRRRRGAGLAGDRRRLRRAGGRPAPAASGSDPAGPPDLGDRRPDPGPAAPAGATRGRADGPDRFAEPAGRAGPGTRRVDDRIVDRLRPDPDEPAPAGGRRRDAAGAAGRRRRPLPSGERPGKAAESGAPARGRGGPRSEPPRTAGSTGRRALARRRGALRAAAAPAGPAARPAHARSAVLLDRCSACCCWPSRGVVGLDDRTRADPRRARGPGRRRAAGAAAAGGPRPTTARTTARWSEPRLTRERYPPP